MHTHTLEVLGTELFFKAKADPGRIERAKSLLDERYAELSQHGGILSKEKLLVFLALSLADDVVLLQDEKEKNDVKMRELLGNIEKVAGSD